MTSYPWEKYKGVPKKHTRYWYVRNDGMIGQLNWQGATSEYRRWDFGNIFLTREDAVLAQQVMRNALGASERRAGTLDSLDKIMGDKYNNKSNNV